MERLEGVGEKIDRDGEKERRGERGTVDVYIGQSDFPPRDVTGQNTLSSPFPPPHTSLRKTEGREEGKTADVYPASPLFVRPVVQLFVLLAVDCLYC